MLFFEDHRSYEIAEEMEGRKEGVDGQIGRDCDLSLDELARFDAGLFHQPLLNEA